MRYFSALILLLLPACMMQPMGTNSDPHANLPAAPALVATQMGMGCPQPTVAVTKSTTPGVLELDLNAGPATATYLDGKSTAVWAYNGQVPGPTLRAKVGDTLIVHFQNNLPEDTSIHWHGMRVPAAMDGMKAIHAGESFTYTFKLLDAGTFWYHPHMNTSDQVDRGLYGAIVVEEATPPPVQVVADEVMVLDDVWLDPASGQRIDTKNDRTMMMGREGNVLLVNGAAATRELDVTAGERRLWRFINSANARYFLLQLDGGEMVRVGGDRGLLSAPEPVSQLLLVPGQRAEVVVRALPGQTATLRALPYERAMEAGATEPFDLVRLKPGSKSVDPAALPASLAIVQGLGEPVQTRAIVLDEAMGSMSGMSGMGGMATMSDGSMMAFTINGQSYPNVPVLNAKLGTVERWDVTNNSTMDHPLHIHGFSYQLLGENEWRDTYNIPAKQTVSLLVNFDNRADAAGMWMYHCHILEHADAGMIGTIAVE